MQAVDDLRDHRVPINSRSAKKKKRFSQTAIRLQFSFRKPIVQSRKSRVLPVFRSVFKDTLVRIFIAHLVLNGFCCDLFFFLFYLIDELANGQPQLALNVR